MLKLTIASLIALMSIAPLNAAEPEDSAARLRDAALEKNVGLNVLTSLTTEVGARSVGSAADVKAVAWAQEKLKSLGFKNIQTTPVTYAAWTRGAETAEVMAPYPQKLSITALGNSVATPDAGLEAEIALFTSYQAMLDAPIGSLKGKIAVVTQRTLAVQDGSGYGANGAIRRAGASEAAKRGAIAYLLRSLGTSDHRFPHTGSMRYSDDAPKIPAAALSVPDADQLERLVSYGKPVKLKLLLTPKSAGEVTTYNVSGDIIGSKKPDEIVLIGGHLDSWDLGTGALDDGAGVAITMAAGKTIIDSKLKPNRTIRVMLFAAEEVGIVGATQYVVGLKDGIKKFIIGAESDFGAGPIYKFSTGVGTAALPAIKRIQRVLLPLGIILGDNANKGGPDIGPFNAAGMPAAELQQDGRDYFDYHHTADDTLDKINPAHLSQNVAAYVTFAWMAANLDTDFRANEADKTALK
jgi:carboxypeptidase Q